MIVATTLGWRDEAIMTMKVIRNNIKMIRKMLMSKTKTKGFQEVVYCSAKITPLAQNWRGRRRG